MTGKPPTMTRRKWALRQLRTLGCFLMGISGAAGYAAAIMGDDMWLPWPVYPLSGALFLWVGVQRLIEDAKEDK